MSSLSLFTVGILEPESETVEYKESWHEDYLKSLAAFANTRGGTLRIGVRNDGSIVGWTDKGKSQETIGSRISETLGVHPLRMEIEQHDGKAVLAVTMSHAATPVSVRGRYYRRVGNSTREVPEAERVRFLLEKTGHSWDDLPAGDAGISDLSVRALADFRVLAKDRLPELSSSDTNELLLDKLRLRTPDGNLKRGAYLLFATEPDVRYRSAEVQIGRFGSATSILDERLIRGNIFDQLSETIQTLRKYLLIRYDVPNSSAGRSPIEDMQRREIWEIPFVAIREAILNALIHRDYTMNSSIQIRVFDDRMTISNPGGLLEGLTVANLLEEAHASLRRNPILAEMIYFTKLIERWGTGTIRMRDACRNDGIADPEFESSAANFTVTFRRPSQGGNENELPGFESTIIDENRILELALRLKQISTTDCVKQLDLVPRRARYLLQRLVAQGRLRSEGDNRWRRYLLPK